MIAAAEVNPLITGKGIKSMTKPTEDNYHITTQCNHKVARPLFTEKMRACHTKQQLVIPLVTDQQWVLIGDDEYQLQGEVLTLWSLTKQRFCCHTHCHPLISTVELPLLVEPKVAVHQCTRSYFPVQM